MRQTLNDLEGQCNAHHALHRRCRCIESDGRVDQRHEICKSSIVSFQQSDGHAHQESPEPPLVDEVAGLGTGNHTRCKTEGGYQMMGFASARSSLLRHESGADKYVTQAVGSKTTHAKDGLPNPTP